MRLILIRHGQTACNITDTWHGWDDCELTELGIAQARALAARLGDEPIVSLHSSDLHRAIQTAVIVGEPHGLTPVPDPAYRERNAGDFQGSTFEEVLERHPSVWEDRDRDYWGWMPPSGESFNDVRDRVVKGIEGLRERYPNNTVAVVGHMGTVRVLIAHLLNLNLAETYSMDFPSTGLSIFDLTHAGVTVELLNDGAHVPVSAG